MFKTPIEHGVIPNSPPASGPGWYGFLRADSEFGIWTEAYHWDGARWAFTAPQPDLPCATRTLQAFASEAEARRAAESC